MAKPVADCLEHNFTVRGKQADCLAASVEEGLQLQRRHLNESARGAQTSQSDRDDSSNPVDSHKDPSQIILRPTASERNQSTLTG